ncbi:hypothetical protein, conserved [Leishmania tarentolae]|uniref:Uncharacterized protein n=1 Tax=Leishmania tarentolae TaxID=5689 RepID=A0A640KUH9_LEITA|nr:hypothetical protein, conserved [Leishmania tarentolae]
MEALFYDHTVTSTAVRQADLRKALQAFLVDAPSRSAIHLIAIFVHIPIPSAVTATTHTASGSRTTSSTSSLPEGGSVAAWDAAAGTAGGVTSQPPLATSRRSHTAKKLAWCAWEADRRLRQAAEDASEMNKWLAYNDCSASRRTGAGVPRQSCSSAFVATVAFLAPHTRDDLVVYESWQRCSEVYTEASGAGVERDSASRTTRMLSPLRHASFIALSLGAPSLLLSWAERPTRCHLGSLLLPYQSLLMDLSWWVATASGNVGTVIDATAGRRVTSSVLRDIFLSDVQRSLKLPKGDSRCAVWISYTSLLASLHPQAMGESDGMSLDMHVAGSKSQRKRGRYTLCGEVPGVDEQAFRMTYAQIRHLLSSLNASQSGAVGRTQFLRVVLSYGGPSCALRRQLVHTCSRTGHGVTAVDAALLRTRSLVDIHALFGVLAGYDKVNMYSEAAAFVRTVRCRASAVQAMQQRHQRLAVESTRVQMAWPSSPSPAGSTHRVTACRTGSLCHNAFVERGARALARKLRLWERKRLGKQGKRCMHARPRDQTAKGAMKRVHGEARGAESERVLVHAVDRVSQAAASSTTGKKRRAELLVSGDDPSSASATRAFLPPQKQRRTDGATARSTPTAGVALSWSEDVAGSG